MIDEMPVEDKGDVTQLLDQWARGDQAAFDTMAAIVHRELRQIAEGYLRRERSGHTLQPTALVNEAWLRLVRQEPSSMNNRKHFFALAAQIMRHVLADHARSRHAVKRGGGEPHSSLDEGRAVHFSGIEEFLVLDEALTKLASRRPRVAEILELRYFGGLTVEEVGELLDISIATVSREQKLAESLLSQLMSEA